MTGSRETGVKTAGETRFVVDCKVKPVALVFRDEKDIGYRTNDGQLRRMKRLNTMPLAELGPRVQLSTGSLHTGCQRRIKSRSSVHRAA